MKKTKSFAKPVPKVHVALELLARNSEMTIAEAARLAQLGDSCSVRRYLAKNFGGIKEFREQQIWHGVKK